jgi:hypothetical protein
MPSKVPHCVFTVENFLAATAREGFVVMYLLRFEIEFLSTVECYLVLFKVVHCVFTLERGGAATARHDYVVMYLLRFVLVGFVLRRRLRDTFGCPGNVGLRLPEKLSGCCMCDPRVLGHIFFCLYSSEVHMAVLAD